MALLSILETLNGLNIISVTFRILLATFVSGVIGSERGRHGRAAGLRTHILVCLGATMTAMVGLYVTQTLGSNGDPLRLGAQVISGIGFLGAGTILMRNQSQVVGLTTAAGLWTTACIGLAIGVGFYWAGIMVFLVVMITFTMLTKLERSTKRASSDSYYLELRDASKVNEFSDKMSSHISKLQIIPAKSGLPNHIGLAFYVRNSDEEVVLRRMFRTLEYVVIAIPVSD